MANGVTSEWEDIHVKLGNYVERPKETPEHVKTKAAIERAEMVDPLEHRNLEELKELEDEFEDEFLRTYMDKRKKELEELAKKPKFTGIREISKQDYIEEVTNAPKGTYVVLLLFQDYNEESILLNQKLNELALAYPTVKFLKIVATRCIENFRDADVPTLIIYLDGTLRHNLIRVHKMLKEISKKSVEWLLKDKGVIPKDDDDDEDTEKYGKFILKKNVVSRRDNNSDDSDSDDGKEYISNRFKRI